MAKEKIMKEKIMKKLSLSNSEKTLQDNDFNKIAQDLGVKLPSDFVEFYALYNGGDPDRNVFENAHGTIGDIEISEFIPMLYCREFKNDPDFTLDGRVKQEWAKNEVPRSLLPFAMDWGGNYICIGLNDGAVYFYIRSSDQWNDDLSMEQNFSLNATPIAPSFHYFIENLIHPGEGHIQIIKEQITESSKEEPPLALSDSERPLNDKDFKRVEQDLGAKLPYDFVEFYKLHNGGTPNQTAYEDFYGKICDIEVNEFLPMLYRQEFEDNQDYTLNGMAKNQWTANKLPRNLLPFARDWGDNYFCIGIDDGIVYYFVRDVWSDNLTAEENLSVNTTPIAPSFKYFIDNLMCVDEQA
ncbi:MAG: SMI1/KNR4 family protein [Peptococcaceae bacterium]|nr:SMI1/KNR4 family protein [Peptococcaceae bacterium]